MIFTKKVTTLANTSQFSPQVTRLNLTRGVIDQWIIFFPVGHEGEHFLQIKQGSRWLLPLNPSEGISVINQTLIIREFLIFDKEPLSVDVHTWNTDTVNSHDLFISINILPKYYYY